ncbi:MAG TPA: hypothetical protein VF140_00115 [Phycicoccus sp.]
MSAVLTTEVPHRLTRARVVALCVLYTPLSLWALVMCAAGPAVALFGAQPDPSIRFTGVAAGAFKALTVGPALAVLLSRGRSVLAVRALVVGQAVWLAADLLAPEEDITAPSRLLQYAVSTALWVGPWLLLAPGRAALWRQRLVVRRRLLVLAAVAAAPLVGWAVLTSRGDLVSGLGGDALELRFDMTGMPLALLAGLVLAAVHDGRWWDRLVATCFLVIGALALVYPDAYGAPGRAAGLLVPLGAAVALAGRSVRGLPPAT